MIVRCVVVGDFQANCYLVAEHRGGKAVLIDPGAEEDKLRVLLEEEGVELALIIVSHGHIDHVGALDAMRQSTGVRAVIHSADAAFLDDPELNLSALMNQPRRFAKPEVIVRDNDVISVGGMELRFIHTPGHTPGSISVLVDECVFTGDCLFAGGIGRIDLPGGDWDTLISSVRDRLYPLPPAVKVYPGHGPETTIEKECRENPYVRSC